MALLLFFWPEPQVNNAHTSLTAPGYYFAQSKKAKSRGGSNVKYNASHLFPRLFKLHVLLAISMSPKVHSL